MRGSIRQRSKSSTPSLSFDRVAGAASLLRLLIKGTRKDAHASSLDY